MNTVLIKNGRVIDPASRRDQIADVLIQGNIIAGIGGNLSAAGGRVIDATGMVVAPDRKSVV